MSLYPFLSDITYPVHGATALDPAYQKEFLQYLSSASNINITDELDNFRIMKRQEILKNHKHAIWHNEKEDAWYTYFPDKSKPEKRKKIKRRLKKDLEDAICNFYSESTHKQNLTISQLYSEWLNYKELHTRSTGTMKRISADWKRYYQEDSISQKKVCTLTKLYLDEWVHSKIKKYGLTKKQYYNMSLLLRQMLPYAVDKQYIPRNPFENVKVESRLFSKVPQKPDHTQVFSDKEIDLIFKELDRHFNNFPKNTAPLAVQLAFYTGMRVGELAAISYEDISGSILHIHCQESKVFVRHEDNSYGLSGFKVVDYTKSDAGDRHIHLTPQALQIIQRIKNANEENNEPCNGFLFVKSGERIKTRAIIYQLERCMNVLSLEHRSIHKTRKTFVSALIDGGININEIRKQVGHSVIETTYACYCFNRYGTEETNKKIDTALSYGTATPAMNSYEPLPEAKVTIGDQKIISFTTRKNRETQLN